MKIILSKSKWEEMGKKAGWMKVAQGRMNRNEEEMYSTTGKPMEQSNMQLKDFIDHLVKMQNDFRNASANLPKEKWDLVGKDCDAVVQYLDNAAGRISTIINKVK